MAKTAVGTPHRHRDGRGKWTTDEQPHTHDYNLPASALTDGEVVKLKALLVAGGGGGTTPVPNPPPGPTPVPTPIPTPAPTPVSSVYGTGLCGDTRSNHQIGGHDLGRLAYSFRAESTTPVSLRVQQRGKGGDSSGYSLGNGGTIRAQLYVDGGGKPSGSALASLQWNPGNPNGSWETWTPSPFTQEASLDPSYLYWLVFDNIATDQVANYISLNVLYAYNDWRAPALPDLRAVYSKQGGAWASVANSVPIFDLAYADGMHSGQSYIGILFGNGGPRPGGVMHGEISGPKQVRERFTVKGGTRKLAAVNVKVKRIGDGASPLTVTLEDNLGWAEPVQIPAAAIAKGVVPFGQGVGDLGGNTWVRPVFAQPRQIDDGKSYSVRLSCPADTRYIAVPLQEGTDKGLRSYRFTDGGAEQSLDNGTSWTPLYFEPTDLQWYGETA